MKLISTPRAAQAEAVRQGQRAAAASDHAAEAHAELGRMLRVEVYRIVADAGEPVGTIYVAAKLNGDAASAATYLAALAADGQVICRGGLYSIPRAAA